MCKDAEDRATDKYIGKIRIHSSKQRVHAIPAEKAGETGMVCRDGTSFDRIIKGYIPRPRGTTQAAIIITEGSQELEGIVWGMLYTPHWQETSPEALVCHVSVNDKRSGNAECASCRSGMPAWESPIGPTVGECCVCIGKAPMLFQT